MAAAKCDDRDCFVHRVTALPIVSASVNQVYAVYNAAKGYSPMLARTFGSIEETVTFTIDKTEPIYDKYMYGLVCKTSKLACTGLDAVEARVPLITMGPQEVRASGMKMYNESRVKKGVDRVVATKDYSVEKVSGAYNGVVTTGKNGVKKVTDTYNGVISAGHSRIQGTTRMLLHSIDYCDELIDRYVADEDDLAIRREHNYAQTSAVTRVSRMPVRIVRGVYGNSRRRIQRAYLSIYETSRAINVEIMLMPKRAWQRTSMAAAHVGNKVDEVTLNGIRFAAKLISTGTDSCVDVCAPRLPVIAASPMKWTQANAHKMQNTVDMVESARELGKKVWTQTVDCVSATPLAQAVKMDVKKAADGVKKEKKADSKKNK